MAYNEALHDLKVVEYGNFVSGPYCTKLMADLGAEVIKVEAPRGGDEARNWGPFPGDIPHPEKSGLFLYLNTNKLGITLNLRDSLGKELFTELVKRCDILVENNPPALMPQLGLDYETLSKVNPRLVMTSITPFGQDELYCDYNASELILVNMSGIGHGTPGEVEDIDREPPLKARALEVEFMAGMFGALATMFAIFVQQTTGVGQHVDVSAQEATAWVNFGSLSSYLYAQPNVSPVREKKGRLPFAPMHVLPCKDGYVHLECLEEHQWQSFVELMGNPEWAKNELFSNRTSRAEYWDALEPLIIKLTNQWDKEKLAQVGQARGIPCTVVREAKDLLSSEQLATRNFFVEVDHPASGKLLYPGAPYQLSQTPWQVKRPAPLLGEHNLEIFCGRLGYVLEDLARMRAMKVI